jgi:hypothetical protein
MVEKYILDETLGFVTKCMHEFQHVSRKIWDVEKGVVGKVLKSILAKVVHSHRINEGSCTQLCVDNKHKNYDTMDTIQVFFCSHIFILSFLGQLFK